MNNKKFSEQELDNMLKTLFKADTRVFEFNMPQKQSDLGKIKYRYVCNIIATACLICIFFISVIVSTHIMKNNTIFTDTQDPALSTAGPDYTFDKKIIYGKDNYSAYKDFQFIERQDYTVNISDTLKSEMEKNRDKAYYKVIITGTCYSGTDFKNYRYEGYTFNEYKEFKEEAQQMYYDYVLNNASDDKIIQAKNEIYRFDDIMKALCEEYEKYYREKFISVFNYLSSHYSFVSYEEPADFDDICLEDYNMLATASYDTINTLARDGFLIMLAPSDKKPAVKETLSLPYTTTKKLSPRIKRDLARNDTVEAYVVIFDEDIEKFNNAAAKAIRSNGRDPEDFYHVRADIFRDYLAELKISIMADHKIETYDIESYTILPIIICRLKTQDIINLANDDRIAFIENYCEWGRLQKIIMF